MKKYLSFVLAAAILLSLISFPSFAAGSADIKDVAVSGGVIVPGFLPTVTDYTVAIDEEEDIPDVLYTLADNSSGVEIVKAGDINETTTITYGTSHAHAWLGRWGIVRNNWYVLKLKKIEGIGSPVPEDFNGEAGNTPDDNPKPKYYIAAEVHILPWAKRMQNVNF